MLTRRAEFTEEQPQYRYFDLKNGKADIFIYSKVGEEKRINEDGVENTSFIYDVNQIKVSSDEITEDMVKSDPMKYFNYSNEVVNVPLEERVSALENAVLEMVGVEE